MREKSLIKIYLLLLVGIILSANFVFASFTEDNIDHLKYYGYYHVHDSRFGFYMGDVSDYTNVIHLTFYAPSFSPDYINNAAELGLKTILELSFSSDKNTWDEKLLKLKGYVDDKRINLEDILALYIVDEPTLRGWDSSLLNEAVEKVDEYFPNKTTMINFAHTTLNPPQNLDWISIDPYFYPTKTEDCEQRDKYDSTMGSLLPWAKSFNKSIIIIGQSFERTHPLTSRVLMPSSCQQNWYYETAKSEPNVIGLLWFMYGDVNTTGENIIGTNAFPEIIDLHKQIGREISYNQEIARQMASWVDYSNDIADNYPNDIVDNYTPISNLTDNYTPISNLTDNYTPISNLTDNGENNVEGVEGPLTRPPNIFQKVFLWFKKLFNIN